MRFHRATLRFDPDGTLPDLALWIPREVHPEVVGNGPCGLPTLNEVLDARGRLKRKAGGVIANGYGELKRAVTQRIRGLALEQGIGPVAGRLFWVYTWRALDRRTDPSNIAAGGRKIVEDALGPPRSGGLGYVDGDGWRDVAGFMDVFENSTRPGTLVRAWKVME